MASATILTNLDTCTGLSHGIRQYSTLRQNHRDDYENGLCRVLSPAMVNKKW